MKSKKIKRLIKAASSGPFSFRQNVSEPSVFLLNDVVAVENRARLMAADGHGHLLRDAGEVSGGGVR